MSVYELLLQDQIATVNNLHSVPAPVEMASGWDAAIRTKELSDWIPFCSEAGVRRVPWRSLVRRVRSARRAPQSEPRSWWGAGCGGRAPQNVLTYPKVLRLYSLTGAFRNLES